MTYIKRALLFAVVLCVSLSTAWAASTLHIGPGAGSTCATGCAGHPNLLGGADDVDIYQTSSGAGSLQHPVLVIFGVPSQYNKYFPASPILSVTATNPYPGGTQTTGSASIAIGGTYGLKDPVSGSYFGTMGAGQEVYGFLGLPGGNKSESFTNWVGAESTFVDLTVTGFALHVFAVDADLAAGGLINLELGDFVPKGSFVIAYGQDANGKPFDVPFTEAGLKTGYSFHK